MQFVNGVIVPGHRVASGRNGNPRFPGGTLRMQLPHFLKRGLDLSGLYLGTINLDIAPLIGHRLNPKHTFTNVKWHEEEPAEDFSFIECWLENHEAVVGWIYLPHPETKPGHFQPGTVIELLLPFVCGLNYGDRLNIRVPEAQMAFV